MKDSQYLAGLPKSWNGGVMSGGNGGLPEEGRGSQFPIWPSNAPPPPRSHIPIHNSMPRMIGSFFGGGRAPAAAHLGDWGVRSLKPPDGVFMHRPSEPGSLQAEGMDLSSRPAVSNGGPLNGQTKEVVSVIAPNPLRMDKPPMDPSDKSDDEDDDCMVIEEGEEAPPAPEVPPTIVQPPAHVPLLKASTPPLVRQHVLPMQVSLPQNRHLLPNIQSILKNDSPSVGVEAPHVLHAPLQRQEAVPPKGDPPPPPRPQAPPLKQEAAPPPPLQKPPEVVAPNPDPLPPPNTSSTVAEVSSPSLPPSQPPRLPTLQESTKSQKVEDPQKEKIEKPIDSQKTGESLVNSKPEESPKSKETPPVETKSDVSDKKSKAATLSEKCHSADHVESLLEDMFQQEEPPIPHPVIVTASQRPPTLTEDKVVAILEESESPEKQEIKTEPFMQVESELEKMFAGIVEPTDEDIKPSIENIEPKKPLKRKSSSKPRVRKNHESAKKSRKADLKVKRKSGTQEKIVKDGSNDSSFISSSKTKGPYVKIIGNKENPNFVTVVNSGGREEEEKDRGADKVKRKTSRIVEGRVKGPGLFSSTLSSKYNSTTVDPTWMCIFCNKRSHCENGLGGEPAGDLFGPYSVSIKNESLSTIGSPTDAEVALEQRKRGGGKQQSLRAIKAVNSFTAQHKKGKLSQTPKADDSWQMMVKEVWVHEQCAVWAPGVILVGPHLLGLEEAVSSAIVTKCSICGECGAGIGCVTHNCGQTTHYGCAVASGWHLDDDNFQAHCPNHKKSKVITLAMLQRGVQ